MNYVIDIDSHSSRSPVLNDQGENTAIKEIEKVLKNIKPSLDDSINLTTIKDVELRLSNLEEKVDQILKILESRKE